MSDEWAAEEVVGWAGETAHRAELVDLLLRHGWPDWKVARKAGLTPGIVTGHRNGTMVSTYRNKGTAQLLRGRAHYAGRIERYRGYVARIDAEIARREKEGKWPRGHESGTSATLPGANGSGPSRRG